MGRLKTIFSKPGPAQAPQGITITLSPMELAIVRASVELAMTRTTRFQNEFENILKKLN